METVKQLFQFGMKIGRAGRRHFVVVLSCAVLGVILALGFALVRGPVYTSSMTVKAVDNSADAMSGALKRLSALGVGGALGIGGNGMLPSYMELLQSHDVAQLLIDRDHMDRRIFGKRVDPATGKWRRGILGEIKAQVFSVFGIVKRDSPTAGDVATKLVEMLVVNQDQMSGLVTVSCSSDNPVLCRDLLLAVHQETEFTLAQLRYTQALRTREYILRTLPNVTEIDIRSSMADSLSEATGQIVMASSRQSIGASIIEPPSIPDQPSFPQPLMLGIFGLLAGLAGGFAIAFYLSERNVTLYGLGDGVGYAPARQ